MPYDIPRGPKPKWDVKLPHTGKLNKKLSTRGIEMSNLVPISKSEADERTNIFRPQTYYVWRTRGKFPHLFVKMGGRVFIDCRMLEQIQEAGRGKAADPVRITYAGKK
jgi:hypothetical protein